MESGLEIAARMGRRALHSFETTGMWPKQPFTVPGTEKLATAWRNEVFEGLRIGNRLRE